MRKLIIDTDTGSDDAVALIMALKSTNLKVEAITTVCGNVPIELATKNALMTIEVANGQKPPLYVGAAKPLMRDLVTAVNVHGEDGMGDCHLIHPTLLPESKHAVDAILELIENNPGEVEIVTIGPVTN
ncbi:MAG: nucleoside hydrolase, partial [Lysinibacillus fusiformis]|nr:nucleoside hydrolase [Lysinibacillus fusiformis]